MLVHFIYTKSKNQFKIKLAADEMVQSMKYGRKGIFSAYTDLPCGLSIRTNKRTYGPYASYYCKDSVILISYYCKDSVILISIMLIYLLERS